MVIPWVGYSLSEFIRQCDPLPSAKYVQFLSYYDKRVEKWDSADLHLLALLRGAAHGRGHEPAHPAHLRPLRRGAAQPERRAGAHRGAVEVRLQIRQIHRRRALPRQAAAHHLERPGAERIRLLLQRQSQRGPSPLEPEDRAPHRPALLRPAPHHADVQRLRRPGGLALQRNGPEKVLLPDPGKILHGSGNVAKHIVLPSPDALRTPPVQALLREATARAKIAFDPSAKHRLIIKSISAKQRPRRPAEKSAAPAKPHS
jgi:hypothetical protein